MGSAFSVIWEGIFCIDADSNMIPDSPADGTWMTFTAVVPVYNARPTLAKCLRALRGAGGSELEIIVVDDASTDSSASIATPNATKVIQSKHRLGASGARNRGSEEASGEILLFVDADVAVPADTFQRLRRLFSAEGHPDAVQGVYSHHCPHSNAASQYKNLYYHYSWVYLVSDLHLVSAASFCFAIRRERFISLGGFDPRITAPTVEDADLGLRLVDSGGKIVLDKDLQVIHDRNYTFGNLLRYDSRLACAKTLFMIRRLSSMGISRVFDPGRNWSISTARAGEMKLWLFTLLLFPCLIVALLLRQLSPSLILICMILFLQAGFLRFVAARTGTATAMKIAGIMLADIGAINVGIAKGVFSYALGRRY